MIASYIILFMTFCHLVFSSTASPIGNTASTTEDTKIKNLIDNGYIITNGIGAHKYHTTSLKWNNARKICVSEGAHLAVINSAQEELVINGYRAEHRLNDLWIGIHDHFQKDEWVTVSDQSLYDTGYSHWASGEPNNAGGNERCVTSGSNGMNDVNCDQARGFICKIYLDHNYIDASFNETNIAS